tara:strand:- start:128 stop:1048 length:921 start_codon:yes stop_codon:yes gene_type:complete
MIKIKLKKIFYFSLLMSSFMVANISCTKKEKLVAYPSSNIKDIKNIPSIKGVAALGQLSPAGEVRKLASPISQFGTFPRIVEILVKEGDFVKEGEILSTFENKEKLIVDLEKQKKLLLSNDKEITLKKYQINMFELATKKEAYPLVSLSQKKDELIKLEKQRINLSGEIESIQIDLYNSQLRSPIDGYVLAINSREGERANSGGVLEIGASQNMEALIEVYESDIDRVFISQKVELLSENGGFEEKLYGFVTRINPQVQQRKVLSTDPTGDADARIIEVLVDLDEKSKDLVKGFAGMKVIAKFIPK